MPTSTWTRGSARSSRIWRACCCRFRSADRRLAQVPALLRLPGEAELADGGEDVVHGLVDRVGEAEVRVVGGEDRPLLHHGPAEELAQGGPVVGAQEDERELADLPGLDEGRGLEDLVQGAEAARQDDEGVGVLD